MRTMALAVHSVPDMTEKWAKCCPIFGHPRSWYVWIERQDLEEYRGWLMTVWLCQLFVTAAILVSLVP
jgi:hypothetical protein